MHFQMGLIIKYGKCYHIWGAYSLSTYCQDNFSLREEHVNIQQMIIPMCKTHFFGSPQASGVSNESF